MIVYISTAAFLYYTIWVLIMPFVDNMNISQKLFLDREWAITIPVAVMLFGICLIEVGLVMSLSSLSLTVVLLYIAITRRVYSNSTNSGVRSARDGIVLKYHFKEDWDETQNSPIDCIASSRLKFWKRLNFNIYLDPEVSNQNLKSMAVELIHEAFLKHIVSILSKECPLSFQPSYYSKMFNAMSNANIIAGSISRILTRESLDKSFEQSHFQLLMYKKCKLIYTRTLRKNEFDGIHKFPDLEDSKQKLQVADDEENKQYSESSLLDDSQLLCSSPPVDSTEEARTCNVEEDQDEILSVALVTTDTILSSDNFVNDMLSAAD
ncbi:Meiotic recombination protein rec6 [Schizosaccharomyces pombe]